MRTLTDIRSTFIDFFKKQGHEAVASDSLVPKNDPSLMFTSAGMVQFKDVFTGLDKRSYTRATTSQKCLRAGGKHNDLENVGYTARHHTFFEMLGNFSFGDYFKEDAISFAWQLITKDFALDAKRLLVTVYADDEEAASIWRKVTGFSDDKIIRIATSDNFWSMGDVGPCGPCTEIFFDHGEGIFGGPPGSPDQDGDRFIEVWNLVFMQYEQKADGSRILLPKPSVDTGMGLERIASVLQGKHNNFDIDLFQGLIQTSMELTGAHAPEHRQSHNVIADHIRACSFLLADGILPSNEGRGYVLRRIMRRAMRHAHILGAQDPLLWRLVPVLVDIMGGAYPELIRAQVLITDTLKLEEERFRQTLDRGLSLLNEAVRGLSSGQKLSGDVAFKLYDTYGFPLDLTQDVLRATGQSVDTDSFHTAMEAQKAAARAAWVGSGESKTDQIWYDLHEKFGATEFLGYETHEAEAVIQCLLKEGQLVQEAKAGDVVSVIVNQTPFYGESGGQVGDRGQGASLTGVAFEVRDCQKRQGLFVHEILIKEGSLRVADVVKLTIDEEHRAQIRANHSATHLLHAALREILGESVTQKGSLVTPERLRFDFTFNRALSHNEIEQVETIVNHHIRQNTPIITRLMPAKEAMAHGAMALFGEKYGDEVRVLSMGAVADAQGYRPYSVELCGGTHAHRTGDIGIFKLVSEVGISAGVRRIEALTGIGALAYTRQMEGLLSTLSLKMKSTLPDLPEKITALQTESRNLERQVTDLRKQLAMLQMSAPVASVGADHQSSTEGRLIPGVKGSVRFMARHLENMPAKELKSLVDELKTSIQSGVIMVTSVIEGRVSLVVGVTKDLTSHIDAVTLVKKGAEVLEGQGGGGRSDMAQAGGTNPAAIADAEAAIAHILTTL